VLVNDEWSSEPELPEGEDEQPGPAIGGLGVSGADGGPAEGLFEEPEAVLNREPQDVVAPQVGQILGQLAAGPGQPERRRRLGAARQPFELDADDGDGRIGRAPGPQLAPGIDLDPAAPGIGQRDAGVRCPVGDRIGQPEDVSARATWIGS